MRALLGALIALALALGTSTAHAADLPFLTTIGPGFGTGTSPAGIAYSPDGAFIATVNHGADTVTMTKLQADGSPRQGAPVGYSTGKGPSAVAFSPDGEMLAVTNETDSTVSLFLVGDGASAGILMSAGPARPVGAGPVSVAFSPNSRFLVTGNRGGGSATLFSVSLAGTLTSLGVQAGYLGGTRTVRFSSRNVLMISVDYPSPSYHFFRFDPATGALKEMGEYGINDAVLCDGEFSPDGRKFAYSNCYRDYDAVGVFTIGEDGTPGDTIGRVWLYPAKVTALSWSPDGSLLATANAPGQRSRPGGPDPTDTPTDAVSMLAVTSSSVSVAGEATPAGLSPSALTFSPDGGHLVVANADAGGFSMFRVARRGRLIPVGAPVAAPSGRPFATAFSADGSIVGTAADTFTLSDSGQLGLVPGATPGGETERDAVAFSPSRNQMARLDGQSGSVTLMSVSPLGALTFETRVDVEGGANAMAFSPDGTLLAVADATGISMLTVSAEARLAYATHVTWPSATPVDLAFRPDGITLTAVDGKDRLVTFGYKPDGTWSLPAITSLNVRPGSHHSLVAVAYSPEGSWLAAADEDTNQLWLYPTAGDAAPEPESATVTSMEDTPTDLVFSPAADTVFVGTYSGLAAYGVEHGGLRRLAVPSDGYGVGRLAISPDGRYMVGTQQSTIATWSLAAPWLEPFIDSGPSPVGPSTDARLVFAASYPARFECRLDDESYVPCTSPWTLPVLAEGAHTASVRARDLSGTLRGAPATWSWKTDDRGPGAPGLTVPAAGAANLPPTGQGFTWETTTDTISAIDRYELWIDQDKIATMTPGQCSPKTCQATAPGPLADGAHSWMIKAYDTIGHATETAPRTFTVDATPPSAPRLAGPDADGVVAEAQPLLSWARSDDGGGAGVNGYEVLIDGKPAASVDAAASSWVSAEALAEGRHTWQVVATDRVGNSSASAVRALWIDQTPPVAALRVSPSRFVPPFRVALDAGASTDPGGAIARYEFDLDGDGAYETTSPGPRVETTLTTLGDHRVGVRVVDRVGRVGVATGNAVGEEVEAKGPKEASVTIDDGAGYTRDRTVSLAIEPPPHSGAVTMIVSNDGRPDQSLRRPVAKRVPSWSLATGDGLRDRRIVYVVFYNAAGLQVTNGRVSDDILYDPFAPTVKAAVLKLTGARSGKLKFRAKDRGSGLQRWQLKSGGRVLAQRKRFSGAQRVTLPKRRVGALSLVLRDRAGNTARTTVKVLRGAG